ncbi:uncharacterized protein METZ01_LOCUS413910, partial [marine metagenome]
MKAASRADGLVLGGAPSRSANISAPRP